jgi:ECF transporter S component (folate family)
MKRISTQNLVQMGLLVSCEIVLSRFCSFNAWNLKIGFAFLPVALAAILMGPVAGGIVGALGDFVGAILFPIGVYFPGFTLTAFLTGLAFGLFLCKEQTMPRIIGAVAVNQFILSFLLNSLWISVLYSAPFVPLLATRILQCAILAPVEVVVIMLMLPAVKRIGKQMAA